MPDLVTHVSVAALFRHLLADRSMRALLLLGAVLPDIYAKTCHVLFRSPVTFADAAHAPVVLLLECLLAAFLLPARIRGRAWVVLSLSAFAHSVLDLTKDHLGQGNVLWGFPFTTSRIEVALYDPPDTMLLAPVALALFLVVEGVITVAGRAGGWRGAGALKRGGPT